MERKALKELASLIARLNADSGRRRAGDSLECPLCRSTLDDSSLRYLRFHLKKAHPGANVYDVKFASIVDLLKEYQRGEKAYLALRNLR